ncbi:helix-hairpin-helix domain-containing protein [Nocardiopsis dassonvillei]|uniref:ATP-dependent exoDNAse (Exonuclease V) alpha subunit-helicase superfamily I member n=1 Tax=Nocardiopsis dassonvillei (strain ATCC 23218 / DSM 43111 / CIP 107115 / JCM 7437 / KCTC 9190 / NBRC 14626 / NCTC 10488 / NRRL B-5397 / IMRU 509) TaxID=446468 RepID=D7AZQ7_NOCDD|nr:helix-hairpin-helix domain-containing protein [Nocardiopsis dassonvillei]ADH68178.1 ATP-dependent exoDNAse (exonuclease V) alpha subunit - helicase superfamily I member [Nocardiopsis dassonvillei subsp. dassonvillei DSM 43111]NKY77176.1 ATP-binding domain-containing protein [Nocardiopsis dassonvillei]VEI88681.1 helicase, RecD/TraA family [Nocardiopsis dassonvillei]
MSEAEQVSAVLDRMGAPGALAPRLLGVLGPGAAAALDANPWLLLRLPQVTPEQADFCARRHLGEGARPGDPRRLAALTGHVLRMSAARGHTVVEEKKLASVVGGFGVADPAAALEAAVADGSAVMLESTDEDDDEDFDFSEGGVPDLPDTELFYALPEVGHAEQRLGEQLLRLIGGNEPIMDSMTAGETVDAAVERGGFTVSDRTREALVTATLRPVTVLRHGPGDAAEIARALVCLDAIATDSQVGIAVAAPTAQAAAAVNADLARIRGERATGGGSEGARVSGGAGGAPEAGAAEETWGAGEDEAARGDESAEAASDAQGASHTQVASETQDTPDSQETPVTQGASGEQGSEEADEVREDREQPEQPEQQTQQSHEGQQDQQGPGEDVRSPVRAVSLPALLAQAPLKAGLVVLCEAMSVGAARAAELASVCADDAHLVLLADPNQAPSATPGQVVVDIAASRTAHVAEVADDDAPGPIAELAAGVASGGVPEVEAPGREVVRVPAASAEEAVHRVVQLVTDSIPRALGIGAEHVQVVTAREDGPAGARAVNAACKERLNPGPGAHGGFDVGDRVLFTAEGPGYGPGDTGHLREVGGGAVVELVGGGRVKVTDPAALRPGWAVTVAAAHGGRWPAVVAVFPPEVPVSRPQVYTALTRATRHVSLVDATGGGLETGVRENAAKERTTRLVRILREG